MKPDPKWRRGQVADDLNSAWKKSYSLWEDAEGPIAKDRMQKVLDKIAAAQQAISDAGK